MKSPTLKILISAAEASSDAHAAELLRSLRQLLAEKGWTLEAFGTGGPALRTEGLEVLVDARQLLAMGFSEILTRLPKIRRAFRTLVQAAESRKPAIAVLVDYPDFHFRLGRALRKQGVPVVDFIPPKVWVWRKGRTRQMKEIFNRVLCIFPFEEKVYQGSGVPAVYVGNPLMQELPLKLTRSEARERLGLSDQQSVLVIMPGSRESELKIHIPLMLLAIRQYTRKTGSVLNVLMPLPRALENQEWLETLLDVHRSDSGLSLSVSWGDAHTCMVAADAGLIKSGTSTLEAGLLGLPHAVVYKPGLLTEMIFKYLIRYRGPVGLVNLALGWEAGQAYRAREWLCDQATVQNLAQEIEYLLSDTVYRAQIKKSFLPLVLGLSGKKAGESAAREILDVIQWRPNA